MHAQTRKHLLSIISILIIFTIACNFWDYMSENIADLPAELLEQIRIFLAIPIEVDNEILDLPPQATSADNDQESSEELADWDINQCNAISYIDISITNFSEDIYDAGAECEFNLKILNFGEYPIRILYYLQPDRTRDLPPSWGWLKGGEIQSNETWTTTVMDNFRQYAGSELGAKGTPSMAFVYAIPACKWITLGGINAQILEIENSTLLESNFPCTQFSFSDITPDFGAMTQGLNVE